MPNKLKPGKIKPGKIKPGKLKKMAGSSKSLLLYIQRYVQHYGRLVQRYVRLYVQRYVKRFVERYMQRYAQRYLRHYITRCKLRYTGAKAKEKLLVDALLLLSAVAIPIAMLGWHDDSRQKQLTDLPISQQPFQDGWQIFKAKGYISSSSGKNKSIHAETQNGWALQCGYLKQYLPDKNTSQYEYTKIAYQDKDELNKGAIGVQLLCGDGAQATSSQLSLTTQLLLYQSFAGRHKITAKTPLAVKINGTTISSARGGVMHPNGNIQLVKDIEYSAPGISISAQKQARLENSTKNNISEKQQKIILEKRVRIQYKNATRKYKGKAELAEVTPCQKNATQAVKKCQVFGIKSLRRITLKKQVTLQEYRISGNNQDGANPVWTLMAQTVVMQDKQARYKGGEKQLAHILFADGTEVYGEEGGHTIQDSSGILCGKVKVRLAETTLESPCLSYNLSKQKFKLETKKLEKELAQKFFKLSG